MTTVEMIGDIAKNTAAVLVTLSPVIVLIWQQMSTKFKQCETDREALSSRISALEISNTGDVPKWIRDINGVFQYVSPEFVRVFGAPRGLHMTDIIGRKFADLPFSRQLVETLHQMDAEALKDMYSCRHGVEVSEGVKATIIKSVRMGPTGDIVYVGYASPER